MIACLAHTQMMMLLNSDCHPETTTMSRAEFARRLAISGYIMRAFSPAEFKENPKGRYEVSSFFYKMVLKDEQPVEPGSEEVLCDGNGMIQKFTYRLKRGPNGADAHIEELDLYGICSRLELYNDMESIAKGASIDLFEPSFALAKNAMGVTFNRTICAFLSEGENDIKVVGVA